MKMTDADIVCTPHTSLCRVEAHDTNWRRTPGELWVRAHGMTPHKMPAMNLLAMFVLFHTITVRDGVDVAAAHAAFLNIDEYRKAIAPDISGAED